MTEGYEFLVMLPS